MIKMNVKFKADWSPLNKLVKQMNHTCVNVGWLNNVDHWTSTPENPITVPQLAALLHYWSPWADQFMFTRNEGTQVFNIVEHKLRWLSSDNFKEVANNIGSALSFQLKENIENVSTPSNSPKWSDVKGFNDPLIFGSAYGQSPSLLGEVKWELV